MFLRHRYTRWVFFWLLWPFIRLGMIPFYKVTVVGKENIPEKPYVIVPNHITYFDFLFVAAVFKTPFTWLMWHLHFNRASWLFTLGGCLPTAPKSDNRYLSGKSILTAQQRLLDGECVVVFPEGGLREEDSGVRTMRPGYNYLRPKMHDGGYIAPVVPVTISGLWGSHWSRKDGEPTSKKARFFGPRREITVTVHEPIYEIEPDALQAIIEDSHPPGSPEREHNMAVAGR